MSVAVNMMRPAPLGDSDCVAGKSRTYPLNSVRSSAAEAEDELDDEAPSSVGVCTGGGALSSAATGEPTSTDGLIGALLTAASPPHHWWHPLVARASEAARATKQLHLFAPNSLVANLPHSAIIWWSK